MNVLIVEDEGIIALFLSKSIERMGYTVAAVTASGEEACTLAASHRPDCILMDVALAGTIDGIDAAECIRRDLAVPIIFTTAYDTDEVRRRAAGVSQSLFLPKPVSPEVLQQTLADLG